MTTLSCTIVVGNGIAAHAFLWTYAKMLKERRLDVARRVIWLTSEIFPTCSLTSTSLISRAGLQLGVSALGDSLVRSYEIFEEYFAKHAHVVRAKQEHIAHGDLANFSKRYTDAPGYCYLVNSERFLHDLAEDFKHIVEHRTATVLSYNANTLYLHDGTELEFDRCFLGLGACNNLIAPVAGTRAVSGQYALCSVDLGNESFVKSKGPHNLIYNAELGQLMVGSLDDKDDRHGLPLMAARSNALKSMLADFRLELPEALEWQIKCGVRHKGRKRLPFWGKVSDDIYSVHSLYKNGYTLSWLAAKELVDEFLT